MRHNLIVLSVTLLTLGKFTQAQTNFWEQTSGPPGANATVLAKDSSGGLLVGTVYGGIYRSTDNGMYWKHINESPSSPLYNWIVVTPTGTLLASVSFSVFVGSGAIFRSSDGGMTWESRATFASNQAVLLLPNGHILAGVDLSSNWGLFRSTDDGLSWHRLIAAPASERITSLALTASGKVLATVLSTGIYTSLDEGNSWSLTFLRRNWWWSSLLLSPSGLIFAGGGDSTGVPRMVKSSDEGQTWVGITSFPSSPPYVIVVDSSSRVYASGPFYFSGTFSSTDDGTTWSPVPVLESKSVSSFLFQRSNAFAVSASVYYADSNHTTWSPRDSGLINTHVLSLTAPTSSLILAGSYATIYRSTNRGNSWTSINPGFAGKVVSIGMSNLGLFYAALDNNGVYISPDSGITWNFLPGSIPATGGMTITSNGNILAANNAMVGGIYISSDGGGSWQQVLWPRRVWSISNEVGGFVYAGGGYDTVYRSSNYGLTWTIAGRFDLVWPYDPARCILVTNANSVFVGTWPSSGTGDMSIYKSTNLGENWTLAASGIGNVYALSSNSLGHIFAATGSSGGVFRSTDDGLTWAPLVSGLTVGTVHSLAFSPDEYLWAGSIGGGVFRSKAPTTGVIEVDHPFPAGFMLLQNYPNPFNPTTRIKFEMPTQTHVELKVFDLLGREVATLVNGTISPGTHAVQFDGRGFASGLYLYQLRASDFAQVRKLLLLK